MAATEEITYGKLFTCCPEWFVDYLASLVNESPERIREALFAIFLHEHLFVCSSCGGEFEATDINAAALVRCGDCRR
jgi:hypothetical protein